MKMARIKTICKGFATAVCSALLATAGVLAPAAAQAQDGASEEPQVNLGWLAGGWEVSLEGEVLAQERYWIVGEHIYGYYAEIEASENGTWDQVLQLGVEEGFVYLKILPISDNLAVTAEASVFLLRTMGENWWEFHNPQTDGTLTYRRLGPETMEVETFVPGDTNGLEEESFTYTFRRLDD